MVGESFTLICCSVMFLQMRQSSESESSALGSMLFGGLAMAYSRSLNPRRLKNCLYPAWLQFCEGIIGDLKAKGVHVELQWPLYFSSEANADLGPDESRIAIANGSPRSIQIDPAILLPKLEQRMNFDVREGLLGDLLRKIRNRLLVFRSPHDIARIQKMWIPFLIQIKRCVYRTPVSPRSCILKMRAYMAHATDQAQDRARCLFSMRRYAHQTSVIVIAVVGDHWKWSRMQRSNCRRRFMEGRYFQHQEARLRDEATKDRGSDCESDMEDGFTDNELVDPKKPDNVDEGHIEQRVARATRREEQAAERERAAKKGNPSLETDDKKGSQPFHDESLDDVSVRVVSH